MKKQILIIISILFLSICPVHADTSADGSISVTGTAAGFSTVPAGTKSALISVETGAVRVGLSTAPTATTGILLNIGDTMTIQSNHDVTNFKVILNSGESSATVRYILFD